MFEEATGASLPFDMNATFLPERLAMRCAFWLPAGAARNWGRGFESQLLPP